MLDKRRLGNLGETYHIIESVLVVVAFQISPGPMFRLSQLTTNKCPYLALDRSAYATNTLPVGGWGLLRIKHTACGWIWDPKDSLRFWKRRWT
ncbi:hypothetical protein CMV_026166 [Castanea mollissima]|uniref:Uncharacterized protein n=1 Tax=Castanea mollissima TaxID=60419 RepID=A0A8J4QCE5_9ROSI|nr:hypothetical protein CMV_026166 [Castanea mollissima]